MAVEYHVCGIDVAQAERAGEMLSQLADRGWQVLTCVSMGNWLWWTMQREAPNGLAVGNVGAGGGKPAVEPGRG